MSVGILEDKRLDAGLSQRELAALAGVDRGTVRALEEEPPAKRPHPKTVRKLAAALGIKPAALAQLLRQEATG